jgi:hypothetical protein
MDTSAATAKTDPADNRAAPPFDPWAMEVPALGSADYVICPPGNYAGTVLGVVDVGHQLDKFPKDGTSGEVRQLALVFELSERRPDGKPFMLARMYTWSFHEKSNFFKLACGVTGRIFKEGDRFSPKDLLGAAVMVLVSNSTSGEKSYHRVESVAAYPRGLPAPRPENAPFSYSVVAGGEFRPTIDLPYVYGQPITEIIEASSEYRSRIPVEREIPF